MIETVVLTLLALGFMSVGALWLWWCVCPIRRDWRSDDFELVNLEGRDGDDAGQR